MKVLPYATYPEPTPSYPEALEAVVTLLSVESRRGKGTGFILKKAAEKVVWISRFVWPLLALPVEFPATAAPGAGAAGTADGDAGGGGRKVLFFDLTGLVASPLPEFAARERPAAADLAEAADLAVAEFTELVTKQRDLLGGGKKPLLGSKRLDAAIGGLIRRDAGGGGEQIAGYLGGEGQLCRDLLAHVGEAEPPDWDAAELSRSIDVADARRVAAEIDERIRAYLAQADETEEIAGRLAQVAEAHPAKLDAQREEVSSNYNVQIDVLRPEVETAIAEHQRGLEERLNGVNVQYSGSLAALEAELSRAAADVERLRGLGKSAEGQLAEARRTKGEVQGRLDAVSRERDNALKQARDHYRSLIDGENDKLNSLIKAKEREIGAIDDAQAKLRAAVKDLAAVAAGAAEHDRKAAADLAATGLDAAGLDGAGDDEPWEFGLPLYVVKLEGQKTRYLPMLPVALKRSRSVTQLVTGLIGGLALPAEARSARYEATFGRALGDVLENPAAAEPAAAGVAASINEKANSTNVLRQPSYKELALEGLAALRDGWLKDKQYAEQKAAIEKMTV